MAFGFCTIVGGGPGVLSEHGVASLSTLWPSLTGPTPTSVRDLLTDWDAWCDLVESSGLTGQLAEVSIPDTDVSFLPPVPDPPTIYGAGANYYDHAEEMGTRLPSKQDMTTFHFLSSPAALTGHRCAVRRPAGCHRLDWEVELAVVIGRAAANIDPAQAGDHIAGYTVANDLSARDYITTNAGLGIDWLRHKSFAALTPTGPALVPRRYLPDTTSLELSLTVNGQYRQRSTTTQMIFSVAEQIAALSRIAPLKAGDMVLTGTPAGTAGAHGHRYLQPGDVVVAEVEGLGRLQNVIT